MNSAEPTWSAAVQTTAETGGSWDDAWRSKKSYLVFWVQLADCSTFVVHWRRSYADRWRSGCVGPAENNGSLPLGVRLTSSAHWLSNNQNQLYQNHSYWVQDYIQILSTRWYNTVYSYYNVKYAKSVKHHMNISILVNILTINKYYKIPFQ